MKRLFLVMAVLAILITNVFASENNTMKPLSTKDNSTKPLINDSRFVPTYSFAIEPVEIITNYYDYFPGSYTVNPIQRVQAQGIDGHWLLYHIKTSSSANRRVYKTFIDNTGTVVNTAAFGQYAHNEGYPGMDLSEGGRPLLAYHIDLDDNEDTPLEVGFGYDTVEYGSIGSNSDLYTAIDNPIDIDVNGNIVSTNQFIWPSVQVGASPTAGLQRVYVLAKNAEQNGGGICENIVMYYQDFTEDELEEGTFNGGTGWESTSIPELNEWSISQGEWRRPYMSFVEYEGTLYYIGYHDSGVTSEVGSAPIDEGTITVFICENYGEGEWQRYSTFGFFDMINPPAIDPSTGELLVPAKYLFDDVTDDMLTNRINYSGHFTTGIDSKGRIHFPAFYDIVTNDGHYYPNYFTVKSITFDTNTMDWTLAEVYPQQKNGSDPFIPNDPMDITQYDSTNLYPRNAVWQWWDEDGDGAYEQVFDDGTYDGIDDGVTSDSEYWGKPNPKTIWPYMYWDKEVEAMMFNLHAAHITNANEQGMMAMIWQDSEKARLANVDPDSYPEYAPYQNMPELVISVSADNGDHWSEPIYINGIDNPEMDGQIPEFPYLGTEVDYIGDDGNGNHIGRIHIMYYADNSFGSNVQGIGTDTGGSMEYMALDVVFVDAPVDNADNNVAPSVAMLNQNYPNPFNPTTTINYNVARTGDVKLNVYNVKGQLVKSLVNDNQNVGSHSVVWNGNDNAGNTAASGVYFYKLENAGRSEMKKMVLMK